MKISKKTLGLGIVTALVFLLLHLIPIYSVTVQGCKAQDTVVRKSALFGSSKSQVDKEAQEFVTDSAKYDCPISKVTYNLFVL